jgi:hypothetical protein
VVLTDLDGPARFRPRWPVIWAVPEAHARGGAVRAQAGGRKLEAQVRVGMDIAGCFRDPRRRQRLLHEVLLPAQRSQISGPTAVQRTNQIAGRSVLGDGDPRFPNWTTGVALAFGAGLFAGVGAVVGICGVRRLRPCSFSACSVGGGAILGGDIGVQVQLAPCTPPQFGGLTLEYSLGGGYNATGSVGIAFAPKNFMTGRTVRDRWQFDGLALQLGGGGGIDASINIEYCHVKALMPGAAAQGG